MSVRIYVEGGGNTGALKSKCRWGFSEFFKKILPASRQPKVIACGSRNEAIDNFRIALREHPGETVVLLVDAETPVAPEATVWAHLKQSAGCEPPAGATEDNSHLMVQCMESWFLADTETLASYFGQGFQASALPRNPNVEEIAKPVVLHALKAATRQTKTKGEYSKGGHSFEILARIDANKVRSASPYAERLAVALLRISA